MTEELKESIFIGLSETWDMRTPLSCSKSFDGFNASWGNATRDYSRGRASGGLAVLHKLSNRKYEVLDVCNLGCSLNVIISIIV